MLRKRRLRFCKFKLRVSNVAVTRSLRRLPRTWRKRTARRSWNGKRCVRGDVASAQKKDNTLSGEVQVLRIGDA